MPHFVHSRLNSDLMDIDSASVGPPPFPDKYTSISDDTSNLYLASVSSSPCSSTSSLSSSSSSSSSASSSSKLRISRRRKKQVNQNLATPTDCVTAPSVLLFRGEQTHDFILRPGGTIPFCPLNSILIDLTGRDHNGLLLWIPRIQSVTRLAASWWYIF